MSGEVERVKAILEAAPDRVNARGPKNVSAFNMSVDRTAAAGTDEKTPAAGVVVSFDNFHRKDREEDGGKSKNWRSGGLV